MPTELINYQICSFAISINIEAYNYIPHRFKLLEFKNNKAEEILQMYISYKAGKIPWYDSKKTNEIASFFEFIEKIIDFNKSLLLVSIDNKAIIYVPEKF